MGIFENRVSRRETPWRFAGNGTRKEREAYTPSMLVDARILVAGNGGSGGTVKWVDQFESFLLRDGVDLNDTTAQEICGRVMKHLQPK
jgi:hypothetical protein